MSEIFTIGFANLDEQNNPFSRAVAESLRASAAVYPNLRLLMRDNAMDSARAAQNMADFQAANVDLLIMYHIDERMGVELVAPLWRRNIPIIAVDIPIQTSIFFGIDTNAAGLMVGRAMVDWVQKNWAGRLDKLLVLTEYRVLELAKLRFRSALEVIGAELDFDLSNHLLELDNGDEGVVIQERVQQVMRTWGNYQHIGIICMNDKMASHVLTVVRALEREQDVIVGSYDGTPVAYEEFKRPFSRLLVSPSFEPQLYGAGLIELSLRILNGERVPRENYIQPRSLMRDDLR